MENNIIEAIENEKNNRFNKSWNKLDKGSKIKLISDYMIELKDEKNISENSINKLQKKILSLLNNGDLNKIEDVEYCQETCKIVSIKNLQYNEKTNDYKYNMIKKKTKSVSKSKSNIERHFSRSKENKR
jgi:hypothetical protein